MPTGVLSLGTIAQRLRAAADSSTLSTVDIENLAACAQTLEGGWPSTGAFASSPDEQRRYIERQARLLDAAGALAWFQITFTDLDVATLGPGIAPFAALGLVDTSLQPKAALSAWDAVFARPRAR